MDEHLEDASRERSDRSKDLDFEKNLTSDLEEDILEEVKIEEVGIDGMCGVY
jgi:mycofactocin precursor